jgi:hypothetical protein
LQAAAAEDLIMVAVEVLEDYEAVLQQLAAAAQLNLV